MTEARGDDALEPDYDVQGCHEVQKILSREHLSMDASENLEVKDLRASRVNGNVNDQKRGTLVMEGR